MGTQLKVGASADSTGAEKDTTDVAGSANGSGGLMFMLKNCLVSPKGNNWGRVASAQVPCGLENRSNNCYCNSVIQSLFATPAFRIRLLHESHQGGIIDHVIKLLSRMESGSGIQSARSLLHKICSACDDFCLGDQQDAHEFLTYLLNKLIDEIKAKSSDDDDDDDEKVGDDNDGDQGDDNDGDEDDHEDEGEYAPFKGNKRKNNDKKRTWLNHLVEGFLKSETKCHSCSNTTSTREPFITISLDLRRNADIQQCLDLYCEPEILSGKNQFYCDSCKRYSDASKRVVFDELPPILILHLKRFKYNQEILNRNIYDAFERLPYNIVSNTSIQVKTRSNKNHEAKRDAHCRLGSTSARSLETTSHFELYSVINHVGTSPNYGHYVCVSQIGSDWYYCDDSLVTKVTNMHAEVGDETTQGNENSYILFYRTTQEKDQPPQLY